MQNRAATGRTIPSTVSFSPTISMWFGWPCIRSRQYPLQKPSTSRRKKGLTLGCTSQTVTGRVSSPMALNGITGRPLPAVIDLVDLVLNQGDHRGRVDADGAG